MKTPVAKIRYPVTPEKGPTRKQLIVFGVIAAILIGVVAWFSIYHDQTGRYPLDFLNGSQSILPPQVSGENQSYEQVIDFVKSDDTNRIPYGFGFNCVDAAFRMWRNATWDGIVAVPIAIQYTDSSGHMVIGFPTNDKGDVFIEPQDDLQIRLRVGQNYNGQTVRGIYIVDYDFTPLYDSPPYDPNIKPG
jgi:hypothetical protein